MFEFLPANAYFSLQKLSESPFTVCAKFGLCVEMEEFLAICGVHTLSHAGICQCCYGFLHECSLSTDKSPDRKSFVIVNRLSL